MPGASDPAGTLIAALPLLRFVAAELYPPSTSVTDPVGVGLPLPSLTATVTVNACAVVMLDGDGVTVTVGVASGALIVVVPEMLEL